jgi:hypothetical protein
MARRDLGVRADGAADAQGSDTDMDGAENDTAAVDRTAQAKAAARAARTRIAQVVWIVCVLAALVLAAGALCIALKANADNSLVKFCIDTADKLDFGVFSRIDGVAHWKGHSHTALTKNAVVNWGLAAVVWLVAGRILDRVIRPSK